MGINGGGLFTSDGQTLMTQFIDQTGVTFPMGWDRGGSYRSFLGGPGLSPFPLDVVIDRDATGVYVNREYDAAGLRAAVERLVAE